MVDKPTQYRIALNVACNLEDSDLLGDVFGGASAEDAAEAALEAMRSER